MSDDLVERVARAIYEAWCAFHGVTKTSMPWDEVWGEERQACIAEARAAIAVVLEEAAKVAENASFHFTQTTPSTVEVVDVRHTIAAAIRAMIKDTQG